MNGRRESFLTFSISKGVELIPEKKRNETIRARVCVANVLTSDKRKGKERKRRRKGRKKGKRGGAYETKGDTLTAP